MCNTAKILDKNLVGFASEKALRELGALCIIELQFQIDSCNEVLRARADTYHSFMLGVSNPGGLKRLFFFLKPTLNIGKLEGGF